MTDAPGTPQTDPDRWETVLDATEQGFTIVLPRGWTNRAWLVRTGVAVNVVATSTSPDGSTTFFTGDPTLPVFAEPASVPFGTGPGVVARPGTSIEHFLPGWMQYRFGALPGFRIVGMKPFPPLLRRVVERSQRNGIVPAWATAAQLAFVFRDGPRTLNGVTLGATSSLGTMWMAEVHGVTTTGDPEALVPALFEMLASSRTTPAAEQRMLQERAASAASHRATMAMIDQSTAQMQATHRQNMANIQASAQSHQARMDSLHASHDAHNQAWSRQQAGIDARHGAQMHASAASDDAHRRFLNTIVEQTTVVDGEGNTHQVAAGYDRYFHRKSDGAWIGLPSHQDLSGVPGIDPNDFEETKIKR